MAAPSGDTVKKECSAQKRRFFHHCHHVSLYLNELQDVLSIMRDACLSFVKPA
jgi:hypothetical protein